MANSFDERKLFSTLDVTPVQLRETLRRGVMTTMESFSRRMQEIPKVVVPPEPVKRSLVKFDPIVPREKPKDAKAQGEEAQKLREEAVYIIQNGAAVLKFVAMRDAAS